MALSCNGSRCKGLSFCWVASISLSYGMATGRPHGPPIFRTPIFPSLEGLDIVIETVERKDLGHSNVSGCGFSDLRLQESPHFKCMLESEPRLLKGLDPRSATFKRVVEKSLCHCETKMFDFCGGR